MAIGRFFYNVCIPTNTMNFFYFKPMLDVIVAFGLGYKGSTYHHLRIKSVKGYQERSLITCDFLSWNLGKS